MDECRADPLLRADGVVHERQRRQSQYDIHDAGRLGRTLERTALRRRKLPRCGSHGVAWHGGDPSSLVQLDTIRWTMDDAWRARCFTSRCVRWSWCASYQPARTDRRRATLGTRCAAYIVRRW